MRFVLPSTVWLQLLTAFNSIPASRRIHDEQAAFTAALSALFSSPSSSDMTSRSSSSASALTSQEAWCGLLVTARRLFPDDVFSGLLEGALGDKRLKSPGKATRHRSTFQPPLSALLEPLGADIDLVPAVFLALHLVYEDAKLDVHLDAARIQLGRTVLLPVARLLSWVDWNDLYVREMPSSAAANLASCNIFKESAIQTRTWPPLAGLTNPAAPSVETFDVFAAVLAALERSLPCPVPTLDSLHVVAPQWVKWSAPAELQGTFGDVCARTSVVLRMFEAVAGRRAVEVVDILDANEWSSEHIDSLPVGLGMHIWQCMHEVRASPRPTWKQATFERIGTLLVFVDFLAKVCWIGRLDLAKQADPLCRGAPGAEVSPHFPELLGTEVDCQDMLDVKFKDDLRFIEARRLLSGTKMPHLPQSQDLCAFFRFLAAADLFRQ